MASNARSLGKVVSLEEEQSRLEMRAKLRAFVDRYGLRDKKIRWVTRKDREEAAKEFYREHPELDN